MSTGDLTDDTGRRKIKGNIDVELTIDTMELAPKLDYIVLLLG